MIRKQRPISLVLLIIILLQSCNKVNPDSSPVGKWSGLWEGSYIEMHIDSQKLSAFSHWDANLGTRKYSIKKDSIFYTHSNYSVKYKILDDSLLILSQNDESDTLIKLDNSLATYDEINFQDSIEFQIYIDEFYKRAYSYYARLGIYQSNDNNIDPIKPEDEIILK